MAHWTIAAEGERETIGIEMLPPTAVALVQGGTTVVMSAKQLSAVADKLFFLNEIYRADLQEALESLL